MARTGRPAPLLAFGLAPQMRAVPSVRLIMPIAAAASMTSDVADIARPPALSIPAAAWMWTAQAPRRGPIGAGHPLPGTPAAPGFGFAGVAGIGLVLAMRRLSALLPDGVLGVVVITIGVTPVGVADARPPRLGAAGRGGGAARLGRLARRAGPTAEDRPGARDASPRLRR
jgi:hypothetical protein